MLIDEKQQAFIQLRILEGKSLTQISETIEVPIHVLKEWGVTLVDHLEEARLSAMDRISAEAGTDYISHYRNLADIYKRLKTELDKRDFSGLPTDKLYHILTNVHALMAQHMRMAEHWDEWDDEPEFMDDFDEFDDFDD